MTSKIALALLVAGSSSCATLSSPGAAAAGQPAPALAVKLLDGTTFDLAAARGEVVVVNFWATWCPPCRAEMPALDAVYAKHRGEGLEMIGVSVDKRRDRDDVQKLIGSYRYRAGLIGEAEANGFGEPEVLPITYVIDRKGTIAAVVTSERGALSEPALEALVGPLLAWRP